jgi:hypothetical protein
VEALKRIELGTRQKNGEDIYDVRDGRWRVLVSFCDVPDEENDKE